VAGVQRGSGSSNWNAALIEEKSCWRSFSSGSPKSSSMKRTTDVKS
jgi:hypothetical protein